MDAQTGERVAARRLRAQRLTGAPCATPVEAVGRLLAMQAQDYGPAKWAVGSRVAGATDAAVEEAFAAGRILRTHVLRPTWHIVLPRDIRWLLTATAPRILARDRRRYADLGLDQTTLERAAAAFSAALRGGNALTRAEMAAVAVDAGVSPEGQRLPYLLMSAELAGILCSGPRRGKQQTSMLLEERAPEALDLPREEALTQLAVRFFTGHGPATVKDLAWWASLTVAEARAATERAGHRLRREEIDGLAFWSAADEPDILTGDTSGTDRPGSAASTWSTRPVHLVQGYDEMIMGYSETKGVLARPASSWVAATPPVGRLVVLREGRVGGFWRRKLERRRVAVEVELIDAWDAEGRSALEAEARRFAGYLGLDLTLTVAG